jgi:hypothetical protein
MASDRVNGAEFLQARLSLSEVKKLLSNKHFSVDGTVIEAWASLKGFRHKDGSGEPESGSTIRLAIEPSVGIDGLFQGEPAKFVSNTLDLNF